MTFILQPPNKPDSTQTVGVLSPPSTISVGSACPCASITHSGLTVNGSGQLVLSANKNWILWASPLIESNNSANDAGTMTFQWYDVTNSTYVGTKAKVSGGLNMSEGRSGNIVSDEKAVHVTDQNNIYELRIISYSGTSAVDNSSAGDYYNRSRCLIWRF